MKSDGSLSETDVARVFSALADEYATKVEAAEGKRTLARIQERIRVGAPRLPARRLAFLTLAPALAAASLTIAVTSWLTPGALTYEVIGAVDHGGHIKTGPAPATLNFSDDSTIVANPQTALNLSVVGEHAALARVQAGKLKVKVEHADETDWRFLAGPYEVRVIGTEFELDWKPAAEQLSVVMHEGRVRVIGPEGSETFLNAGQSRTFGTPPKAKLASVARDPSPKAAAVAGPTQAPAQVAKEEAALGTGAVGRPAVGNAAVSNAAVGNAAVGKAAVGNAVVGNAPPSWAKLVGKGLFSDVVQDAERIGLEQALNTRGVQDLQALAQAAHYTGRSALALDAWAKVRQRFGGKQAAFFMGRIYDQRGNAQSALRWLNVYLNEAGSDVYASEALGRKLTLVQRLQGEAQAKAVAREYLRRFPKGPYARTARDLLK